MKHFFIYALAAVLLFTLAGRFAAAKSGGASSSEAAPRAALTAVQAAPMEEMVRDQVPVGLLQASMSSMDDMYFKNALVQELGENFSVHCLETSDECDDQSVMFQKMVESGYKIIVVQLYDRAMADGYIQLAKENEVTLIFTGVQPDSSQMEQMEDLYYVGFSSQNTMRELADAIIMGWNNNQDNLDLKSDDRLIYGVFTKDDYSTNGNEIALDSYLASAGIDSEMGLNAITQAFSFDLEKEVDNILYAGGEMIICDNSTYARQISNYLHDPEEFTSERLQNTRIFLTTADEGARKMVEEGTAMFATGANGEDLGKTAAKLIQTLALGQKPTEDTVGVAPERGRCFYVSNRSVTAALLKEKAPEKEAD